jgi:hypothetical protein
MYRTYSISAADEGFLAAILGFLAAYAIIIFAIYIITVIGMWKMYEKAGREGWKAIIPIYNMYVLTEISGQNGWLFLLCLIPGVGALIWSIMVSLKLAPAYGKDTGFAIGLILLAPIFYMILGFGDAQYVLGKPAGATSHSNTDNTNTSSKQKEEDPWVSGK